MLDREDIDLAAVMFAETAQAVADDLAVGDVGQEEDFSGQLIGRIKGRLDTFQTPRTIWQLRGAIVESVDGPAGPSVDALTSVRLSGRQLSSKGHASEESQMGADLLLVLDIRAPNYSVRKGVLIQAKRLEVGTSIKSQEADRLRSQCGDMLDLTPSSFVFLYSSTGVETVSASSVEASRRRDLHALVPYADSLAIFFADFLLCWVGDPRLSSTDRDALVVLRAATRARNALLLRVTSER